MAEGIALHVASDVMEVSSAGLAALGCVQSLTKLTLAKNGYPAGGLHSKPLENVDLKAADIIINMTGRRGLLLFRDASQVEDWDVEDPYGSDAATYQRIFVDIERRVAELAERLRNAGSSGRLTGNSKAKGTGGQRRR
jgi:protein-tyrosine-phosphatase